MPVAYPEQEIDQAVSEYWRKRVLQSLRTEDVELPEDEEDEQ